MRSGILVLYFVSDVNESRFSAPVLITTKVEFKRFRLTEEALAKFTYYLSLMQPAFDRFVKEMGDDCPVGIDEGSWGQIQEMRRFNDKSYFQVLVQQIIFDPPTGDQLM